MARNEKEAGPRYIIGYSHPTEGYLYLKLGKIGKLGGENFIAAGLFVGWTQDSSEASRFSSEAEVFGAAKSIESSNQHKGGRLDCFRVGEEPASQSDVRYYLDQLYGVRRSIICLHDEEPTEPKSWSPWYHGDTPGHPLQRPTVLEQELQNEFYPDASPANFETKRMMVLSTAHITPEANNWLTDKSREDVDSPIVCDAVAYGYLIWVSDELPSMLTEYQKRNVHNDTPACVINVLLYARELNFDYLMLDRDGPKTSELKTYDW